MELVSAEDAVSLIVSASHGDSHDYAYMLISMGETIVALYDRAEAAEAELARCKPAVDAASICRAEYAEVDDSELPPIVVDILKAIRAYEAGERAPEYSATEQECSGCMGPCGRCEEESDAG
jgi:hypothetical protein